MDGQEKSRLSPLLHTGHLLMLMQTGHLFQGTLCPWKFNVMLSPFLFFLRTNTLTFFSSGTLEVWAEVEIPCRLRVQTVCTLASHAPPALTVLSTAAVCSDSVLFSTHYTECYL